MFIQKVLFSSDECSDILSNFTEWVESKVYTDPSKPAVTKPSFRKSFHSIYTFGNNTFVYDRYKDFLLENDLVLLDKSIKLMAIRYNEGDYLKKHDDVHSVYKRRYAVISQLSNDFDYSGGDFIFHTKNDTVTFNRQIGNSSFFPVETNHEVKKITKGTRYSLIFFLCEGGFVNKKLTVI